MNKILVLSSENCAPCKMLKEEVIPILEMEGMVIDKFDVGSDEGQALAMKYRVRSVPTVIVLDKEDNVQGLFAGYKTAKQFKEFIKSVE